MFKKAVIKLTATYSLLFIIFSSVFSLGLYAYVKNTFNQGYTTKVHQRALHDFGSFATHGMRTEFSLEYNTILLNHSAQVMLENLRRSLLVVNVTLLFVIPYISWFLARRTLAPIRDVLERQKQFVSDVSHELRTPLTIAENEIELALQHQQDTNQYVRTLNSLKEEMGRLSGMIENLLLLARHENPAYEMPREDVEIIDVISQTLAALSAKMKDRNIPYNLILPEENCIVLGNKSLLSILFYNLIDNAIKFSPEATAIAVTVSSKKQQVAISVNDHGIGIQRDDQVKIFDRFFRADTSRSATKGYGLGLAIAKMIVELHHGSLSVESKPEKGSTFTAVLNRKP